MPLHTNPLPRTRADDAPLRIAVTSYRSHPRSGGQGVYLRHLTRSLVDLGHDVEVISGPPYPELDPRVALTKIPSLDLYAKKRPLLALRPRHLARREDFYEWWAHNVGRFPEPYSFGVRFARWISHHAHRFDILHDNQTLSWGVLAAATHGLPVTATLHHPITRDLRHALENQPRLSKRVLLRQWHSFLPMQMTVARQLPRLLTISENSRRDFADDFGLDENRLEVALLGVDAERFQPAPGAKRSDDLILCTASADVPLKGLRHLIDAYAKVLANRPATRLRVVGALRKGPTRDLVERLGLENRIEFVSGISDETLAAFYAEAAIVACPSLYEGFGLPAGEAMASGAAVVAARGGALPEVVGDAGVLVPTADPNALAEAILQLLNDPAKRASLGARARKRVLERFEWSRCARETVAHYRRVLQDADDRSRAAAA